MIDLKNLTIEKAHKAMKAKELSAVDLVSFYIKNIDSKNKEINAYLEVYDDVLEQAKIIDQKIKDGIFDSEDIKDYPLLGIPFALKDNILIKGKVASASSKILENYKATYDATAIERMKKAGAIFIGRTNMDEFAMGGSTENSAFGVTRNPYDLERVAGGSSGGSAAAVAMDGALASLGTDTGGSVRQPSSFCGIVGLKPTYGAISRHGIMAMGSSLDQIGPMAKTVKDVETIFNVIKGQDKMDSTTISDNSYSKQVIKGNKPKIGIPFEFLKGPGINPKVLENFNQNLEKFKKMGYEVEEISLPNIKYSLPVYYIIMPAEVSSNMARFDGVKYGLHVDGKDSIDDYFETRGAGLGKEVRRRILLGTYVLSSGYYDAYYAKANIVRKLIAEDFVQAFKKVDIIITPTTPSPAFKVGEKTSDPVSMYLEDIFTVTANLTGMPAMSIPCGLVEKDGKTLPVGMQMTANLGQEQVIFDAGKEFLGE